MTPITVATNTPGTPIPDAGKGGFAIAITPDGKAAYVANDGSSTVTPIDLATNTAGTPVRVGSGPFGIAITSIPQAIPTSTQLTVTAPSPTCCRHHGNAHGNDHACYGSGQCAFHRMLSGR